METIDVYGMIMHFVMTSWHGNTSLALCEGNLPADSIFKWTVMWNIDISFVISLRRLNKQSICSWFGDILCIRRYVSTVKKGPQIAKFMGPIWGPPGSCRPQMGPMSAPWTLLTWGFSKRVFSVCSSEKPKCGENELRCRGMCKIL